jgi:hypothetical protein
MCSCCLEDTVCVVGGAKGMMHLWLWKAASRVQAVVCLELLLFKHRLYGLCTLPGCAGSKI